MIKVAADSMGRGTKFLLFAEHFTITKQKHLVCKIMLNSLSIFSTLAKWLKRVLYDLWCYYYGHERDRAENAYYTGTRAHSSKPNLTDFIWDHNGYEVTNLQMLILGGVCTGGTWRIHLRKQPSNCQQKALTTNNKFPPKCKLVRMSACGFLSKQKCGQALL